VRFWISKFMSVFSSLKMLFDSSLRRDLSRNFGATVIVLVTIVMTILLIRTLGQASRGSINPSEVLLIMGFNLIGQMTTILALSLFITVVATLSRMYSDSEMVIWFSSGQGLLRFTRPLLRFAWPMIVAIVLLALFAWPWSNQQMKDLQQRYEKRNDIERVAPGQFQESGQGKRVFFIDKDSPDKRVGKNVFVYSEDGPLESTTTAEQGRVEFHGPDRFLMLESGQQLLRNRETGEVRITRFKEYDLLVDTSPMGAAQDVASRQIASIDLLRQPTPVNLGELSWRLGLGLCALNLMLLGLSLSAVNPRAGRSYQFGLALLTFVLYYNMVNIGQSWINNGRIGFAPWMLGLHGGMFSLAMAWLWARHRNWSWRSAFSRWSNAQGTQT
jgi:lipopolysaccharide export system permease protein